MIRINLLPVRAAKKKESTRFQLTLAGLITVFAVMALAAVFFKWRSDASMLKEDIVKSKQEIEALKTKVGELAKLRDAQRVVQSKLDVVRKLEAGRTGPVEMFKKMSLAMPDRAWVTVFTDNGKTITINGSAATDETVASLMRGFEAYTEYTNVELVVARRVKSTVGVDVVDFTIKFDRKQ